MPMNLLSKNEDALLNEAVGAELYASHLYRHIANQMQRLGYFGAQKFFHGESDDELTHYQRVVDYMNDRGTVAKVPAIEAMDESIASMRDAIQSAFDTELQLGRDYEAWYKKCDSVTTQQFLLQFLEIQRKSVGEYGDLLARLERCGTDNAALLMLDKEMSE